MKCEVRRRFIDNSGGGRVSSERCSVYDGRCIPFLALDPSAGVPEAQTSVGRASFLWEAARMSPEPHNPTAQPSAAAAPARERLPEGTSANSDAAAAPSPDDAEIAAEANGQPAAEAPVEPAAAAGDAPSSAAEVWAQTLEGLDQLIDQYAAPQQASSEGELVEGRVIAVTEQGVVVDIGAKSEGLIPAQEFVESEGGVRLEPGQAVEVQLTGEEKEGYILLSYQRARRRRAWENIEKSYRHRVNLTGQVVDRIKGGLVVDIGIRAFLPASQVELRPTHDLDAWKGQEIACRVLKMNRKRGNVVVSRRVILEEELRAQRQRLMDSLAEGQVVAGKVKNITDYGVFVDLGGLDGLLHITDLSWGRLAHPSQAVSPGQEIQVKVLRFDREKMRVSLGRKQLLPDPWATVPERYPVGARVSGRVVGITDYGAFVELEPGIEGLVHISEMSWSKRLRHPSKIVAIGDAVEVAVLDLRPEQRRISLGLKQTMPDPWQTLVEKYPVGTVVRGRVRNLTDFGAFVEIEEGFDGLIHVSDISWTERVKHPSKVFKKGDAVEARVLKIDPVNRRVSLGVKQVNDIWADWFGAHQVNDVVRGRVSRVASFGAFVELAAGIEGLCHVSEIEERRNKADKQDPASKPAVQLEPGQEYDFKVIKLIPEQRKIGLSYRAALKQAERRDMEEYRSSKSSPTATIGDAILSKRESM
jgi:small subunit ribosomal protein S1